MTADGIREAVLDILSDIIPDENLSGLKEDIPFREQLELDSMDFLDIVMELRKRYRIQIPEKDYPQLASMASTVAIWSRAWGRWRWNNSAQNSKLGKKYAAMYDTIIIGAGMSGLAAGIRLAYYEQRSAFSNVTRAGGLNSVYGRRGRTYDVGLHAMTNYSPKGTRQGPLARLLRQLRLGLGRIVAGPPGRLGDHVSGRNAGVLQRFRPVRIGSRAVFPAANGRIPPAGRGLGRLRQVRQSEIHPLGPGDRRPATSTIRCWSRCCSARCCSTAAAREHDIDFGHFSILFRSMFLEGLARPLLGMRLLLKRLLEKFSQFGGELRLRATVSRIVVEAGEGRSGRVGRRHGNGSPQRALLGRLAGDDPACAAGGRPRRAGRGAVDRGIDLGLGSQPALVGLRPHAGLLQRFGEVPLREARRAGRPAERGGLLAQQFRLQRADARRRHARFRPGQLRPLGRPGREGLRRAEAPSGTIAGPVGRAIRARFPRCGGRLRHVHARRRSSASPATTRGPSTARSKNATTAPRTSKTSSSAETIKDWSESSARS